ncbi:MAG: UDP-4-amino-4,6-dideoxy-N-acetyl-beta-L-altrosamine transaminase [Campylobacterales bacterium]
MRLDRYSTQSIDEADIQAVVAVLRGGSLTGGEAVERFEADLCAYTQAAHCVTFSSATAALHAAYAVCGIGAQDEVIVPAITFAATANAALYCGARPVFADIRFSDGLIDARRIEALITPKTRAIVPVHYAGALCDMAALKPIAQKHNLTVIEDAAHALGSFDAAGKSAGTFGRMGIFSFHPVKPITTGEGGAIVTDDALLADRLRLFRSHGIQKGRLWDQEMVMLGHNYRLSDIACALGSSQLAKLDAHLAKRQAVADFYDRFFKNSDRIFPLRPANTARHSRHLYPVLLDSGLWCAKESIFETLRAQGIGVQVHYKPVYRHRFYRELFGELSLPQSEDFYRAALSLPCHGELTIDEAAQAAQALLDAVNQAACKG